MTVTDAAYAAADNSIVTVTLDGVTMTVPLTVSGYIPDKIIAWIAAGNTPAAYVPPAQ